MIASGAVFVRLLHPHRRVTPQHAQDHDFAGALACSASAITGTKPAHDTKRSSSNSGVALDHA